jgi:DNA-directed RNA polymerase specialized sigma24 family protein
VTPSLIDRRPRGELIAELYDRHAAGLFAYCHDQLGDTTSAADALVAVLTSVATVEPPRAALYALARREIYRRDVAYVFPSVDPAVDPVTALIERVVREIRPHQREVLLLSAVCGLDTVELAWVLDVAADTAEQLVASARHRFTRSLAAAVASAESATFVPAQVTEVFGALMFANPEDALARLPWRVPSGAVRVRILSAIPEQAGAADGAARAGAKRLWPTTPKWPLPLAEPNPFTNTGFFPAKELAPPEAGRRSRHEATTEPMPKVRASGPGAPGAFPVSRRRPPVAAAPVLPDVLIMPATTGDTPGTESKGDPTPPGTRGRSSGTPVPPPGTPRRPIGRALRSLARGPASPGKGPASPDKGRAGGSRRPWLRSRGEAFSRRAGRVLRPGVVLRQGAVHRAMAHPAENLRRRPACPRTRSCDGGGPLLRPARPAPHLGGAAGLAQGAGAG